MYCTRQGEIKLFLNGFIPLLSFDLSSLISYQEISYLLTDIDFSENFDYLMILSEEQELAKPGKSFTLS